MIHGIQFIFSVILELLAKEIMARQRNKRQTVRNKDIKLSLQMIIHEIPKESA